MVSIEEIRRRRQLSAKKHIEEERRNFPYVGYVPRRISPYLTKFFIEHNISANHVSACSILLGIIANFTFTFGDYFFLYGIIWIVIMIITSATNYRSLTKHAR